MPRGEKLTNEDQLERWRASSDRRKFWRARPRPGQWTATVEDETGRRVTCAASGLERACELLLGLMRSKGLL